MLEETIKELFIVLSVLITFFAVFIFLPIFIGVNYFNEVACDNTLRDMNRNGYYTITTGCMIDIDGKHYPDEMIRKEIDTVNIND